MIDERPARVVCHRPGPLNETGGAQGTAERIGSNELAAEGANQRRGSCRQPRRVLRKKKKLFLFFSSSYSVPKDGRKENKSLFPFLLLLFIYICMRKKRTKERAPEIHMAGWWSGNPSRPRVSLVSPVFSSSSAQQTNGGGSIANWLHKEVIHPDAVHIYLYLCVCVYIYCTAGCFFIIKTDLGGPYIHSSGLLSLSPSCSSDLPSFFFTSDTATSLLWAFSLIFRIHPVGNQDSSHMRTWRIAQLLRSLDCK